ncbi:MAG TPA: NAD(P)/FAD-dependent oxidoreductase, partial [Candidatus Methanomethylicus sp.]|nr:NAD(P)/FAD-dependent oxidoreductase [Candidatus Methanomethylicus sp.]
MDYDVIIIGAGPAGMFGAYELAYRGNGKLSVLVIDQGHDVKNRKCPVQNYKTCTKCPVCSIMSGVGGAGTLSSGLLNLRPDIGGDLIEFTGDEKGAWDLVNYVDSIFLKYGAPKEVYRGDVDEAIELQRRSASCGIKFLPITQRHMGSDGAPKVIDNFKADLERMGINFMLDTRVEDVNAGKVILDNGTALSAQYILLAPGRVGANW